MTIYKIYNHKIWKSLTKDIQFQERIEFGENNCNAKLTESQVKYIILRLLDGDTCKSIADNYGVNRRLINDIRLKATWRHLTQNIIFPKQKPKIGSTNGNSVLTEKQVIDIKYKLNNGVKGVTLAKEYNVTPSLISRIKLGKCWNHIKIS